MEKRTTPTQYSQTSTMYCNNCGQKGHVFRTCRDPVLSCGIFLLNTNALPCKATETKLLMIRRKDSMSFAEFMRGKYDPEDTPYVSLLFKNMTLKEQSLVVSENFDTLWKYLWGDDRSCSDYGMSKEKFGKLNRMALMRDNLSEYTEPEWGFPKGRRMRGESDMDCALREFSEETNVPRDAFIVLRNILLEETFMGLNGIRYKHVYFVALLKDPELVNLGQKFTAMQRREISGIAWKSFQEADELIRPHHIERHSMLEQLRDIIQTFETA
jgi:8-oxo-dGTP pyrophosphatase MutT (NUDIX family)